MAVLSDTPIYDEVVELQRTYAGPFARYALEEHQELAAQPVTEPLEQQPRRAGAPRSQR